MNELLNADKIRELSYNYYQQQVTKEQYRRLRKQLLDQIDREMNNIESELEERSSATGIVDKVISYFKKSDKEELV